MEMRTLLTAPPPVIAGSGPGAVRVAVPSADHGVARAR